MIDLHTHSTASDGTLSPSELVEQAAAAGVTTLALTDHDCIAGIPEAKQAAKQQGIQLIPGVELSVSWSNRTLHLVGLSIDIQHPGLNSTLDDALAFRRWRAEEIARKLAIQGIENALEGAQQHAKTALISRTHFAHFLAENGYAKDTRRVFKKYLVKGKPGHVRGQWISLADGIDLIHQSGGLAVLAHPARYSLSRTKLRGLFQEFKKLRGDAIEAVSGSHGKDENLTMAKHALDFELPVSVGSDYHGPEKPWIQLGRLPEVYYRCQPVWEAGLKITETYHAQS